MIESLSLAALALVPFAAPSTALSPSTQVDHAQLARSFARAHRLEDLAPEAVDLGAVLERDFVRARLGAFEVIHPAEVLSATDPAEDLRDICAALVEAQRRWLAWADPGGAETLELQGDLETLRKWIVKWKPSDLAKAKAGAAGDVLALLAAPGELRDVIERLQRALVGGAGLGIERAGSEPVRLLLMPDRTSFVEFLCFAGWWRPELAGVYWVDGVEDWMHFFVDDLQVYALQFPAMGRASGDYTSGTSMNERNPTGLEQQITQLALTCLIGSYYGDRMPEAFATGVAMNLVIEQFGEVDTRIDGDLSEYQTQKREVFVPGGQSEGGRLPKNVAGSRWRADQGRFHFTRVLRQAQKAAAGERTGSKNKLARFLLKSRSEKETYVLSAPVLGAAAQDKVSPPDFVRLDHLEFLRSYKSAFLFWLRGDGAGSEKKSAEAFAQLLRRLVATDVDAGGSQPDAGADGPDGGDGGDGPDGGDGGDVGGDPGAGAAPEPVGIEVLIEEVYGLPLSNAAADDACLEGRFLKWLSHQKAS